MLLLGHRQARMLNIGFWRNAQAKAMLAIKWRHVHQICPFQTGKSTFSFFMSFRTSSQLKISFQFVPTRAVLSWLERLFLVAYLRQARHSCTSSWFTLFIQIWSVDYLSNIGPIRQGILQLIVARMQILRMCQWLARWCIALWGGLN